MTPRCAVCSQPVTPRRPAELICLDAKRREVWVHYGRCMARYNDEPLPAPQPAQLTLEEAITA